MLSDMVCFDNSKTTQLTQETKESNLISVEGKGTVTAEPDTAILIMGVTTENESAEIATAKNKEMMINVLQGLSDLGIPEEDIKTQNYSIFPKYDYVDGKREFTGYEVRHILEITVENIENVGIIIEKSVKNGVNYQQNITFTVSDFDNYYQEALSLAVENAYMKAENIANTIGVKLNQFPLKITEKTTPVVKPNQQVTYRDGGAPIQTGTIKIPAMVNGVFQYSTN